MKEKNCNCKKKLEELENLIRLQDFEIKKIKEALVLIDAKINKKPLNYFEYSTDEEDDFFYLDNIYGV